MTNKLNKHFEFQIQYATEDGTASVETLSCTNDRQLLHDILDELLDKSMAYPQPQTHDEELQTIFWVRGAGCPIRPHKHDGLTYKEE